MDTDHRELKEIIITLSQRCRASHTCAEIVKCLETGDWDSVIRCCEVRLEGYRSAFGIDGKALLNAQLGTAYLMRGQTDQALHYYKEAASLFSISDRRNAGLVFMALGKAHESRGDFIRAAQYYSESLERLIEMRDPLAVQAAAWLSELTSQIWSESRRDQMTRPAQRSQPLPITIQLDETLQQSEAIGDAREPIAATKLAAEPLPGSDQQQPETTQMPDEVKKPSQKTEQRRDAGVNLPLVFPTLALLPICEDRIAAGKPVIPWRKTASYLTTASVSIDNVEFYLRDVFGISGEPRIESFNFAALVRGKSMEPTLHDGDCVLVRKVEPSLGDIVVVRVPNSPDEEGITIKRYYPADDHILFIPDNPDELVMAMVESIALIDKVQEQCPEWIKRNGLQVIIGTEAAIEGKVAAVLSPLPSKHQDSM